MNLIILEGSDHAGAGRYVLTDSRADHIRVVLKAEPGDSVAVGLLNGPIARGRIETVSVEAVSLVCEGLTPMHDAFPIDLILAMPRPKALKRVLVTIASMAVRSVHLVNAARVEKSYFDSPVLEPEIMRSHLIEGLSQGKHTQLPNVTVHKLFRPFVEDTMPQLATTEGGPGRRLLCHPGAKHRATDLALDPLQPVRLAIGPEGGWVPFEVELLEAAGFESFELGPWVLRVEAAVAVALGQISMLVRGAGPG